MKRHYVGLALSLTPLLAAPAHGQPAADPKPYVPDLSDFMAAVQVRHVKLWFAGRSQNWELARYEIERIRRSLEAAASAYPKLGDADFAEMTKIDGYAPLDAVKTAVDAHNTAQFSAEFDKLTQACNSCHRATNFAFVRVQAPTASPVSNQTFAPPRK
jgi:hypothetical protein